MIIDITQNVLKAIAQKRFWVNTSSIASQCRTVWEEEMKKYSTNNSTMVNDPKTFTVHFTDSTMSNAISGVQFLPLVLPLACWPNAKQTFRSIDPSNSIPLLPV